MEPLETETFITGEWTFEGRSAFATMGPNDDITVRVTFEGSPPSLRNETLPENDPFEFFSYGFDFGVPAGEDPVPSLLIDWRDPGPTMFRVELIYSPTVDPLNNIEMHIDQLGATLNPTMLMLEDPGRFDLEKTAGSEHLVVDANEGRISGSSSSGEIAAAPTEADGSAAGSVEISTQTPNEPLFDFSFMVEQQDDRDIIELAFSYEAIAVPEQSPIAEDDDLSTVLNDRATPLFVTQNDSDPDGGTVTITGINGGTDLQEVPIFFAVNGQPTTTQAGTISLENGSSALTFLPLPGVSGSVQFTYEITDDEGDTDPATVVFDLSAPQTDPEPVFYVADDTASLSDSLLGPESTLISVLENDTSGVDGSNQPLEIIGVNGIDLWPGEFLQIKTDPDGAIVATLQITGDRQGFIVDSIGLEIPEPVTFTYTVRDAGGEEQTATVTVNLDREDPIAADDRFEVDLTQATTTLDLLGNDTSFGPSAINLSSVTYNGVTREAVGEAFSPVEFGDFALIFDGNEVAIDPGFLLQPGQVIEFSYQINDGNGRSDTASVRLDLVQSSNTAPVAEDDVDGVVFGGAAIIDVLDNDTDAEGALKINSVDGMDFNGDQPLNIDGGVVAVVVDEATGTEELQFIHDGTTGAPGDSISFDYTVTDSFGLESTATVTLSLVEPTARPQSTFGDVFRLANLDGTNGYRIDGTSFLDTISQYLSGGGDFNGDGFDDAFFGSPNFGISRDGTDAGAGFIIFGAPEGGPATRAVADLDGDTGVTITPEPNGAFIWNMTFIGDVNGDGLDDVALASPEPNRDGLPPSDPGHTNDGAVYVLFGQAGGLSPTFDLENLTDPTTNGDGGLGFRIDAPVSDNQLGYDLSSAGDINGDGFDDLLISTRYGVPGPWGIEGGQVYVIYGGSRLTRDGVDLGTLTPDQGFTINHSRANINIGKEITAAGDINGDGFDDLIVADPGAESNAGERDIGLVHVVFGSDRGFGEGIDLNAPVYNDDNSSALGFRLTGLEVDANAGQTVTALGDINGDGFDDIGVTVRESVDGGARNTTAYVIFGAAGDFRPATSFRPDNFDGSNGFRIGDMSGDDDISDISSAGDINGDGFDDILIGLGGVDANSDGFNEGVSYVVFGKPGGFDQTLTLDGITGRTGFKIVGEDLTGADDGSGDATGDYSGTTVSAAGDLNGDGFDDLLIGAITTSPDADRYSVGSVYVVYGRQAYATEGDDLLIDSASANAINGMDGNDEIYGNGGNDILTGGNGRDWLDGGQGDDEMFGGLGNDTYVLDSNGDRASEYSGQGTDTVIAPFSIDLSDNAFVNIEHVILQAVEGDIGRALPGAELRGNDADNELIGNVGSDDLRGGDGKDTLIGLNGGDELRGQKNGDRLEGGNGSDDLRGGKGNDDLRGGKGGDDLRGERGNDDLMGGGGSDTLRGGYGQDDLTGNSGRDTFDFNDIAESGRNSKADTITDFERGKDVIDLKGIIGPTFDFIGTDKFDRGGDNQVRIDDQGRTVIVEIDIDDDRNSEMEIEVLDVGRLNASDFLL